MRKADFPIFNEKIYGKDLVFLDSAASAQKPKAVLDAMYQMAVKEYANVHRGAYYLSEMATNDFEQARQAVADFIHARPKDIIFTRGATDAINLVAGTFGRTLKAGDEIVLSIAEHHSNLVPWQLLRDEKGVVLKFIDVTEDGLLDMDAYRAALTEKTKLVAMTHMSNVLGTMFPVKEITRLAHEVGAKVLIDGCQGIVHTRADMADIGCEWYAFSGHKIYGPTGIGVLYGRWEVMNELLPLQGGGDMVKSVHTDHSVYADSPARFEAGTPAIVETVGLRAAIAYVTSVGMPEIEASEEKLMAMMVDGLSQIPGFQPLGRSAHKKSLVSFNLMGSHPQDVAMILDQQAIAVRVGHHCAQPVHERFGVTGSIRASLGLYNDEKDVVAFINGLKKAQEMLS